MIDKIIKIFKEGGNHDLFPGVSENQIKIFETKINGELPELLKTLYLNTNGAYDGGLLEFLPLNKVKNIEDFDFGYYGDINKSEKNLLWGFYHNDIAKCLIKNHENYFSFIEYNFGGGYWFINLKKSDKKYGEILLLYNHMNEFYKCQPDINNFFKLYIEYGAIEILLDSEIEIEKYLEDKN